jgi:hypothetical protein
MMPSDHVGSPARLILLYLQTEALRTGSREVELGNSMRSWLFRVGIPAGGTTGKCGGSGFLDSGIS